MAELTDLSDHHESVPHDRDSVPYVAGCKVCDGLQAEDSQNAHPFSWLNKVATHFAVDHGVKLFITKP